MFPEHGPASTFSRKEQRPRVPSASITAFLWPQSGGHYLTSLICEAASRVRSDKRFTRRALPP